MWPRDNKNLAKIFENQSRHHHDMLAQLVLRPGVSYSLATDSFDVAPDAQLTRPISVCIHVNRWCNLKCSYCLSDSGPAGNRGIGKLKQSLDLLSDWAPLRLVWSGGEPMLQDGITDLLQASKRASSINILTTNGTTLPSDKLVPHIDWIDISLHGIDASTFKSTTGTNHFDLVSRNIKAFTKTLPRVSASLLLIRRFVPGIYDIAQKLRDAGVRRFRVSRLLRIGRGNRVTAEDLADDEVIEVRERLAALVPEVSLVLPAVRKHWALLDGYFVLENDGTFSSPPLLSGKTLLQAPQDDAWKEALGAHHLLFHGITD